MTDLVICQEGEKKFRLEKGSEPHIQKVVVFGCSNGWNTMKLKWEIHKLEGGFVVCCGMSQKPKYIFGDEAGLASFLIQNCGTQI